MKFSVIVCTYNRVYFLHQCLKSIVSQISRKLSFEVIVIDNNSTDETPDIVNKFCSKYQNVRYKKEMHQGLSHARNRGYHEAMGQWVIYIDDDAKLDSGYIERLDYITCNYDFDCFGGMYYAWHFFGKPKWLPKDFGNKKALRSDIGLINGKEGWLSGGNFAIKKEVIQKMGGFDPEFGMNGNQIRYGEEDHLQRKMYEHGYNIGFDPSLVIYHAVLSHKLKLGWHLKASFYQGQAREQLNNKKARIFLLLFEFSKSVVSALVKRFPASLFKLLSTKNYYWQNLVLDIFNPVLFYLGGFVQNCRFST